MAADGQHSPPPFVGRLRRAQQISHELRGAINEWATPSPVALKAHIAEDRLAVTVSIEVTKAPQLDKWAYMFGEAVHQIRAALDNYLVSLAKESGITNHKRIKRIQFSIASSAKEWADNASRIADLPGWARERIEQVQPFQRGASPEALEGDLLVLLRDLSNQDKHQARVITGLTPMELGQMAQIEFETEEGATASVPPDVTIHVPSFETGGLFFEQRTKGRIAKVQGRLDFRLQVHIVMPDGKLIEISTMLASLGQYTEMVLAHISDGQPKG